jgi:hypothetical protein
MLFGGVFLQPLAALHADGGTVRLSERKGDYRITVFTSPTPLRAGPVDISVFVQDAATGAPMPEARITVRATPRDRPGETICHLATMEAATNKLFQSAVFDLPEPGWWEAAISVEGSSERIEVHFEMEADEPLPRVWEMTPWIAWPAAAILLFGVHQWLVRQLCRGAERIKKASSHEREPAQATLSPNQRDTNKMRYRRSDDK